MRSELARPISENREDLLRYLQSRFPRVAPELLEDAAHDACLDALERSKAFEAAWSRGGEPEVYALFRCVAWRKVRGNLRQTRRRDELHQLLPVQASTTPGQEHLVRLVDRVEGLIIEAVTRFGGSRKEALRQALVHKLLTGEPDRSVALLYEVPREYLNRAKRFFQDNLWGP